MLRYERVTVRFGAAAAPALDDVTIDCPAGTTTMVLGPSGCGKSTLLRLAVGLLTPQAGRVLVHGRDLVAAELRSVRHGIGYVLQDGGLFPHLDAYSNVALLPRHLGWPEARVEARFGEVCALARFDPALRSRHPDELSGGQRQRVGLMRALMLDPPLLLLDEPLSALDPLVRYELQMELRELFRRHDRTVVMVTHDVAEAVLLGERAVLMSGGRVVQEGTPADLLLRPATPFAAAFVAAQRGARELLEASAVSVALELSARDISALEASTFGASALETLARDTRPAHGTHSALGPGARARDGRP
jgi:osmoprotectant transport system ATP-binding protein